jgi:hypothetical protein
LPQLPQLCKSLLALTHSAPHAFCPLAQDIVVGAVVFVDCAQLAANSAQATAQENKIGPAVRVCMFTSEWGVARKRYRARI